MPNQKARSSLTMKAGMSGQREEPLGRGRRIDAQFGRRGECVLTEARTWGKETSLVWEACLSSLSSSRKWGSVRGRRLAWKPVWKETPI